MYTRHNEVPVFETFAGQLDANHYNHVHVALNRLGESLRIKIPGLKTLELILLRDAWIVVDRAFNDIPVVAWTDFEADHRSSLHEPINCAIKVFHANAGMILRQAIEKMDVILTEKLVEGVKEEGSVVIPFNPIILSRIPDDT
ncbi:MAG: hypothetical protein ACE5EH_00185 [Gammaproteobacteria bacterium]